MRQTEELDLIPDDQNGSRKNRRSVLTALNKAIVTDISRHIQLPISITSNDVQACYDRTVLWIASMSLQRIGLSQEVAFSVTNTLQSVTHTINTAFGLSIEKIYPDKPSNPR